MAFKSITPIIISFFLLFFNSPNGFGQAILFNETFEDSNFSSRGWYDNTGINLSSVENISGSSKSAEFRFLQGATTPTSGGAFRRKFSETGQVYISYYVKYSTDYTGSDKSYHPHEFYLLTNLNGDFSGLAYTRLTAYVEHNEGVPLLSIQDGENIDETKIGVNLVGVTENRSVAGCNGNSDGYDVRGPYGDGDCYNSGSLHRNGKILKANGIYFSDSPGSFYKNDWHFIEAFFKLNSIDSNGKGVKDGVLKYWYDGTELINISDAIMRTGQHPNMKFNQFVIAPYIGDGSPVDQTFWVDDLSVATSRPGTDNTPPSSPKNLKVQ